MIAGEYIYLIQASDIIKVGMTTSTISRIRTHITGYDGDATIYMVQVPFSRLAEQRLLSWCHEQGYMRHCCGLPNHAREHLRRDIKDLSPVRRYMDTMMVEGSTPIECTLSEVDNRLSPVTYTITRDHLIAYTMELFPDIDRDDWSLQWERLTVDHIDGGTLVSISGTPHTYKTTGNCHHCMRRGNRRYQTVAYIPGYAKSVIEIGSTCIGHLFTKDDSIRRTRDNTYGPSIVNSKEAKLVSYLNELGVPFSDIEKIMGKSVSMVTTDRPRREEISYTLHENKCVFIHRGNIICNVSGRIEDGILYPDRKNVSCVRHTSGSFQYVDTTKGIDLYDIAIGEDAYVYGYNIVPVINRKDKELLKRHVRDIGDGTLRACWDPQMKNWYIHIPIDWDVSLLSELVSPSYISTWSLCRYPMHHYYRDYKIEVPIMSSKHKLAMALTKMDKHCNRDGAWIDYPIVPRYQDFLLDEMYGVDGTTYVSLQKDGHKHTPDTIGVPQIEGVNDWIPTLDYCKHQGDDPMDIADVVVPVKGNIEDIYIIDYHDDSKDITHRAGRIYRALEYRNIYIVSSAWIKAQSMSDYRWVDDIDNQVDMALVRESFNTMNKRYHTGLRLGTRHGSCISLVRDKPGKCPISGYDHGGGAYLIHKERQVFYGCYTKCTLKIGDEKHSTIDITEYKDALDLWYRNLHLQ